MTTYGMTDAGFNRKPLSVIKSDIEERLRTARGDNINVSPQSGYGQLIGIFSEAISDAWVNQEGLYNSQYPSTANGAGLSNAVGLNGITRNPAVKSTATCTFTGTAGTVLAVGTQVKTNDTGTIFETLAEGTIEAGGTIDIAMQAVEAGPFTAVIGTLTEIETPVYGWESVTNAAAAIVGEYEETDVELRIRQEASVALSGRNNSDTLYAQLLEIEDVTGASVYSNGTDATVDGVPAHRFRAIVEGGTDADIADVIWANTPQAILSFGAESVVIQDAQGSNQTVQFSRPTPTPVYFKVTITTDSAVYPPGGDDAIKENIAAWGNSNFDIGDLIVLAQFYEPIMDVPGILTVTIQIGLTASPSGTSNLTLASTDSPVFDDTYVEVV